MSKGRVLVVDDLPDVRVTLSGLLSDEGYDVRSASNREKALQMIDAEHFDVAVLDVRLDETDEANREGLLLMHKLREDHPDTAIIVLTGYADVKMVREALQPDCKGYAPAFGFLEKSEIDQLLTYVDRAMEHVALKSKLSAADLIADGESERVEFKSSMRWDYRQGKVNKDLEAAVARAMAGMLNCEGGALLIGVADDGAVVGLDKDLQTLRKSDIDGFELALTDIVKNYLGIECMQYIHPTFGLVDGKHICTVSIQKSPAPVYLSADGAHEFWLRVGNSTRELDVKETVRYIENRW